MQNKTVEGIDAFCKKRLESWIENVNSYIVAKNKLRREIFFISYEWLHNDPETALLMLAEFLGLQVNKNMITTAIKNHTFNKHHESEKKRWNSRKPSIMNIFIVKVKLVQVLKSLVVEHCA